jgi:hypothetical protein
MQEKRPLVLASLDRWSATPSQQEAIRAQLRGLGAQLLIVCDSGTTLLSPDDEPQQLASAGPMEHPWGLEVSVIDAYGQLRWSQHVAELSEPPADALLTALRSAAETMNEGTATGKRMRELPVTPDKLIA